MANWKPEEYQKWLDDQANNILEITGKDKPDAGLEKTLQRKCLDYLKEHGWPCFHDYSKRKNQPGWPDLFCFLPGRVELIELKAGNAKLRKEQKQLKLELHRLGYQVHVVRSYKRFLEIMKGE